jgi:hypothetical protein
MIFRGKHAISVLVIIFGFSFNLLTQSHIIFHQDVFHGGVTAMGYNPTWNYRCQGSVDIYIEPGSNIRKAYLLVGVEAGFFLEKDLINKPLCLTVFLSLLDTVNTIGNEFFMSRKLLQPIEEHQQFLQMLLMLYHSSYPEG